MNDQPRPKILVVDDIQANLVAMRAILRRQPAEIIEATGGNEALALSLDHEFAMVLLDVQMPEMDGYEVAEILRSTERTENTPIIFVTASHREFLHELKGYEVGAVDYIGKPVDEQILNSKVSFFLDLYQSKRALEQKMLEVKELNDRLVDEIHARVDAEEGLKATVARLQETQETLNREIMRPLMDMRAATFAALRGSSHAASDEKLDHAAEKTEQMIQVLDKLLSQVASE